MVLTHKSRQVAQEESNRQTALLMQEIEDHRRTDEALQQAKQSADFANQAKSRYITAISHELRTPLNSILGYAQIVITSYSIHYTKLYEAELIVLDSTHGFGVVAVDMPLHEHVHIVIRLHPDRQGLADQIRIGEHLVADLELRAVADQAIQGETVATIRHLVV